MLAALGVKCPDSRSSETRVLSPHNFGLWVEQSPHPGTSELPACSQLPPDVQKNSGTYRELQASQRQEVI